MKFKYLLLSFVLLLSLHSCGGDDDVVPVEQEVTDPTDPGNGGNGNGDPGNGDPSLIITCDNPDFQSEVVGRTINLSWNACTASDGSEITYSIYVIYWVYECGYGYEPREAFYNTMETSFTLDNLSYYKEYGINVFAMDVNDASAPVGGTTTNINPTGVIEGNVVLTEQKQVNTFLNSGITEITGNLELGYQSCFGWAEGNPGISSLAPFAGLERIGGDVIIDGSFCPLTSYEGFESLTSVGGNLKLSSTDLVENYEELSSLETVGGNLLLGGNALTSIDGFESLTSIGDYLGIRGNNLTHIPIFENLTNLNRLSLEYLPSITEINAFNNVTNNIDEIIIDTAAQSINILNNVNTVGNITISGPNLNIIAALNNATDVNNITLQDLPNITEIDAFNNISNSVGNVLINTGAQTINVLNNVTTAGNFSAGGSNLIELTALTNANSSGDFSVNGANQITALTNATTTGDIQIFNVQTLNGFEALETVGRLSLNNINASNSTTFEQLQIIDELTITGAMYNVNSFLDNLNEITNTIDINFTSGIQNLNFSAITSSNPIDVNIRNNADLQGIAGLNNTILLTDCYISANPQLMNIDFLSSVTQITGSSLEIVDNDQLTNLDALSNLNYIECPGELRVIDNFNLGDLCGLQNFFINNGLCSFNATIETNGYNPTPLQIENGDCML